MTTADALDRGREAFGRWAWADAFEELSAADQEAPLAPEDLERLAAAAYLVGRDADRDAVLARAHQQWLRLGGVDRAARCGFWLAFGLLSRGDLARGGGWVARARRLLDDGQLDCVEQGWFAVRWARRRGQVRARRSLLARRPGPGRGRGPRRRRGGRRGCGW